MKNLKPILVIILASLMLAFMSCEKEQPEFNLTNSDNIYINPDNQRRYMFHTTDGRMMTVEESRREMDRLGELIIELNKKLDNCK